MLSANYRRHIWSHVQPNIFGRYNRPFRWTVDKKKDMDKEDKDMDKEDKDKEDKDKDKEEAKSELDRELWRSLPGWLAYNGGRTTPVYWGDFGLAALANTIPPSPYWLLDPLLCPVALQ